MNSLEADYMVTAGFDAVVDSVVRVVKEKGKNGQKIYFKTIEEFAEYLLTKTNKSCSVDLEIQEEKIGGNMAIFSNAMGQLGMQVHCVGSMGYPKVLPIFQSLNRNCMIHSVCQSAQCNALEFNDGKVMLSSMDVMEDLTWQHLRERLNIKELITYFKNSDLIALLNWSELVHASELYRRVYEEAISISKKNKNQYVLFDLSDASRKTGIEIEKVVELIEQFSTYRTTILSMNENEIRLIEEAVWGEEAGELNDIGRKIIRHFNVDYVVIHLLDCSLAFSKMEQLQIEGYFVEEPKISTGGGDNFNAGLCLGFLSGCSLSECLKLANATSGFYVRTGRSPSMEEIQKFMKEEGKGRG